MPGLLLARLRRLPLLAAACAVAACPVTGCAVAGGGGPAPGPSPASSGSTIHQPFRARPSPRNVPPAGAMPVVIGGPARLADQLTAAETVLHEGGAPRAAMARQALIVQLACLRIAAHPGWASVVTQKVAPARRAAAAADIAATRDLVMLTRPAPRLPRRRPAWAVSRRAAAPIAIATAASRSGPGGKIVLPQRGSNWVKDEREGTR